MAMKATDLARLKGTKIMGQMKQARAAGKPGAAPAADRREQRKLDQAAGLVPSEAQASLSGLSLPLNQLITQTVEALVDRLGLEKPDSAVHELGNRWRGGRMILHPHDPALATKEIDLDQFFHKIVMMRNQLRVLEQKINGHEKLSDAEKVEMQQYITRCYGSMTSFNVMFKDKEDQF